MGKQSSRADDLEIIKRYSDMVYRMAFSLLKNKYDAEDIHQEVFVRYFRKRPEFESGQHERAWFLRVTVNLCRNFWKELLQSDIKKPTIKSFPQRSAWTGLRGKSGKMQEKGRGTDFLPGWEPPLRFWRFFALWLCWPCLPQSGRCRDFMSCW